MSALPRSALDPNGRSPSQLIDALGQARREHRVDLAAEIAKLTEHDDPLVREEALSALLSGLQDRSARWRAVRALTTDEDFGVRSQAAISLARISTAQTLPEDTTLLVSTVKDETEDLSVRQGAYDALLLLHRRVEKHVDSRKSNFLELVDWQWLEGLAGA